MDLELIEKSLPFLLQGALITIEITMLSVGIGFFIGLFTGIARISRVRLLRITATIYADGISLLLLLLLVVLIVAPMFLKFLGQAYNLLILDKWKQGVL